MARNERFSFHLSRGNGVAMNWRAACLLVSLAGCGGTQPTSNRGAQSTGSARLTASITTNAAASGYPASYANDNNSATQWVASLTPSAANNNAWVQLDFGATMSLQSLHWTGASGSPYPASSPSNYTIQVSNDGANWNTVLSRTNSGPVSNGNEALGVSGRYLRLTTNKVNDGTGWSLSFFEIWATGVPLATGSRLTASITTNAAASAYPASYANDNNSATQWVASLTPSAANNNAWVQLDFGATMSLQSLHWTGASGSPYPASSPTNYTIQVSNDGANWNTVLSRTNSGPVSNGNEALGVSGRYLRLTTSKINDGTGWSLSFFEIWATGAAGGSCTPTTCAALGLNCGTVPDGCGSTLTCGSCVAPATCGGGGTANVCGGGTTTGTRNALKQPFASSSIWNMPIGSNANYVPANIPPASLPNDPRVLEADQDIIVLTPTAPLTSVYYNSNAWNGGDRCPVQGPVLTRGTESLIVPIPSNFVLGSTTWNAGLAVLHADGRTISQTQPFARCTAGGPATSNTWYLADVDLYGDGIPGAHGGSSLSAIGGTLRVGELRPGGPQVQHALKIDLYGKLNFYNDGVYVDSYRWPATSSDGLARYGGTNPALKEGSLLALPTSININTLGLLTEPARRLAWTLQNYGAYVVDDTAVNVYALCTEFGPDGDFTAQFKSDWGFSFGDWVPTPGPWQQDIQKLVSHLSVVNNNTPASVGGGGTPLQPLATPIAP